MRALVLLLMAACAAPRVVPSVMPPPSRFGSWPGCYALSLGAWQQYLGGEPGVLYSPPAVVRLDTTGKTMTGDSVARRLEPNVPILAARGAAPPHWRRQGPDSAMLEWFGPSDGVRVLLEQGPYAITGLAFTGSDGQYRGIANVSAERVSCVRLEPPTA